MRDLILMLSFIDSLYVVSSDETDRITKVLSKGTNIPAKTSLFLSRKIARIALISDILLFQSKFFGYQRVQMTYFI